MCPHTFVCSLFCWVHVQVTGESEMLLLLQAVDVVLDAFPIGSYITSLQVLYCTAPTLRLYYEDACNRLRMQQHVRHIYAEVNVSTQS
jgi:hypothetical protein